MDQHLTTAKVWIISISGVAISATKIEIGLKIIVLLATLGYTLHKWAMLHANNKKNG